LGCGRKREEKGSGFKKGAKREGDDVPAAPLMME